MLVLRFTTQLLLLLCSIFFEKQLIFCFVSQEQHKFRVADVYFKEQRHSDLPSFATHCLNTWSDALGAQVLVLLLCLCVVFVLVVWL